MKYRLATAMLVMAFLFTGVSAQDAPLQTNTPAMVEATPDATAAPVPLPAEQSPARVETEDGAIMRFLALILPYLVIIGVAVILAGAALYWTALTKLAVSFPPNTFQFGIDAGRFGIKQLEHIAGATPQTELDDQIVAYLGKQFEAWVKQWETARGGDHTDAVKQVTKAATLQVLKEVQE